jgi:hypothetical protein
MPSCGQGAPHRDMAPMRQPTDDKAALSWLHMRFDRVHHPSRVGSPVLSCSQVILETLLGVRWDTNHTEVIVASLRHSMWCSPWT